MTEIPPPPHPFAVSHGEAPLPPGLSGAVVAIGNFDGVHRGHRAVIAAARERASDARPARRGADLRAASAQLPAAAGAAVPPHRRGRQAASVRGDRPFGRHRAAVRRRAGGAFAGELRQRHPAAPARNFRRRGGVRFPLRAQSDRHARTCSPPPAGCGTSPSTWCRRSRSRACASPRASFARRSSPAISRRRTRFWAIRGSCAARSCTATSADASSAIRPPIFGSIRPAACATASTRCGSGSGSAAMTGSRASAGGRCSMSAPSCSEVFLFDFSGDLYGRAIDVAFIGWIRHELAFA